MAVAIMGKTIRLDKYLTEMNKGSRSQIKEAAKKGRIQVNGQTEKRRIEKSIHRRIKCSWMENRLPIMRMNTIC